VRTASEYNLPADIDREVVFPSAKLGKGRDWGPCHWASRRVKNPTIGKGGLEGRIRATMDENTTIVKEYDCEGRAGRREGRLINGSMGPH